MNGETLLRLVNEMHQTKNIPKEVIFSGIEAAVQLAAERATGSEEEVTVHIDRDTGEMVARRGEQLIDPEVLGRIAAQSAKQLIIQKIREAESETVYEEFRRRLGRIEVGNIQRIDNGTAIVALNNGKVEAILPRSEQIPGETHHVGERVKAVVMDVKRSGNRVKIVLSRCHPDFLRCLFEDAIPEIQDRTIEIRAVAREAGYRSKIAVSSIDLKVDCVGACVGVRGSRIKNIIDECNGERIDIVRWNDSLQVLIPNALQPAEVSEVFVYPRLGRAIVLVEEDQLSLAIGRRGQNVRLASKLVGWDIEIMTHDELSNSIAKAERRFRKLPELGEDAVQALIEEGFLSYTDLTFMEPEVLAEITGLSEEQAEEVIALAEELAEQGEDQIEEEEEAAAAEAAAAEGEAAEGETAEGEAAEGEAPVPTLDEIYGTEEPAAEAPEEEAGAEPAPAEAEWEESPAGEAEPEAGDTEGEGYAGSADGEEVAEGTGEEEAGRQAP
ncbi:MAG TPA: transcription termination factor NusA [Gemmataceae bacterium]